MLLEVFVTTAKGIPIFEHFLLENESIQEVQLTLLTLPLNLCLPAIDVRAEHEIDSLKKRIEEVASGQRRASSADIKKLADLENRLERAKAWLTGNVVAFITTGATDSKQVIWQGKLSEFLPAIERLSRDLVNVQWSEFASEYLGDVYQDADADKGIKVGQWCKPLPPPVAQLKAVAKEVTPIDSKAKAEPKADAKAVEPAKAEKPATASKTTKQPSGLVIKPKAKE